MSDFQLYPGHLAYDSMRFWIDLFPPVSVFPLQYALHLRHMMPKYPLDVHILVSSFMLNPDACASVYFFNC